MKYILTKQGQRFISLENVREFYIDRVGSAWQVTIKYWSDHSTHILCGIFREEAEKIFQEIFDKLIDKEEKV